MNLLVLLLGLWAQTSGIMGPAAQAVLATHKLALTVGKSTIVDSPGQILRVSIANPDLVETVAISPHELLINGKGVGETSMILWTQGGERRAFELKVEANSSRVEAVRSQIEQQVPGQKIELSYENETVFLRGNAKDVSDAARVAAIAGTLGKVVNLLQVDVPPVEPQILLKVRFADVDRSASQQFGINLFSTGATNTIGAISTGQSAKPIVNGTDPGGLASGKFTISDALNVFLFRNDLNLGATIEALETKGLLQMLAEPNLLTIDGKAASFLSGGEFPFPSVQGGAVAGAVSISFRKYGVSIEFMPHVTPRGTIRLQVVPEVSTLDFANAVLIDGFNVPALSTRRIDTEVELESGQSFAIAGMLDNRLTETISRIPGLANIPLLGKLFESRTRNKNNTELLVLVTPELVKPVPAGQAPQIEMPKDFISGVTRTAPSTPGQAITGPPPAKPPLPAMPLEDLLEFQKQLKGAPPAQTSPASPFPNMQPTSQPGVPPNGIRP